VFRLRKFYTVQMFVFTLWPRVVTPDRDTVMDQSSFRRKTELFNRAMQAV